MLMLFYYTNMLYRLAQYNPQKKGYFNPAGK